MVVVRTLARWTQVDLKALSASTQRTQLLTIPYSHYCEFARWSLEVAGIPYDEHAYPPGAHAVPAIALRVGDPRGKAYYHLSKTSSVQQADRDPTATTAAAAATAPAPHAAAAPARPRRRRSNATAVPALCLPDGITVLPDSWSIAEYCFGRGTDTCGAGAGSSAWPPGQGDLMACLDEELGVLARQLAYAAVFRPQNAGVWDDLCLHSAGVTFRTLYMLGGGAKLKDQMVALFRTDDHSATAFALARLRAVVEKISMVWLRGGAYQYVDMEKGVGGDAGGGMGGAARAVRARTCLPLPDGVKGWTVAGGCEPGVADYAMASLAAVLILPEQYCAGQYTLYFNRLLAQDVEFRAQVEEFRGTAVGRHCAKMYREYRNVSSMGGANGAISSASGTRPRL